MSIASEMFLQFVLCVLVADFITGVIHWWEDTYGNPNWPVIGKQVIEPNINHHERPSMADGTFLSRNWQPMLGASMVLVAAWLVGLLCWQLAVVAVVGAMGNETHSWCHGRSHWLSRLLQECGIAQTPQNHAKHHRGEHDSHFCAITNVVNPILERLHFWKSVEFALSCVGIHPLRGQSVRGGH